MFNFKDFIQIDGISKGLIFNDYHENSSMQPVDEQLVSPFFEIPKTPFVQFYMKRISNRF